jgi:hypothetical protein
MAYTGAKAFAAIRTILVVGASGPGVIGGIMIAHGCVITGVVMTASTAVTITAVGMCILRKQELR